MSTYRKALLMDNGELNSVLSVEENGTSKIVEKLNSLALDEPSGTIRKLAVVYISF